MNSIEIPSPAAMVRSETGTLPGGHPYVTTGNGPRALAVLPGFGDAMFPGTYPPFSGWAIAPYFGRYLGTHTVCLLSRPRSLPSGYDVDDAVSTHALALEAISDSHTAIDVIGISMGGLIGQALTHREPELIDRLVVANSACDRLADVDHPTLVFGGERDPFFPPALARETAAALSNGELELVPGAKHGAFHERKLAFDARVQSFLERDTAGRTS
ncbi:alpha/beta fold hydrolase [Natrialbaceae archaeon AArc-T1-2]|uniref:alpha/beta fold hydrolase n=1 Tax=Natrialbaceae archaeon AArc-T1-2 TaxID=3053904 RepID=UPI00255ACC93|nr:alpha/beta hydrolase [Natrialbaceae archaeon AArc-T1-2]WIV66794.1 alpha/beta hydrolase [Natrialbaceae archaeon AArc-T1-2]